MSPVAVTPAEFPVPKKRGPKTPEGRTRSSMNALRHGLRARAFGLLPEESPTEWVEHLAELRRCYGPVDAAEEKLVAAIAVAMWNEIRADRTLVQTMAAIPPAGLHEPGHARAMGTALRYLTAAGMATQRGQRAFLAHPKAKQAGLILAAEEPVAQLAAHNCTNELASTQPTLGRRHAAAGWCTNDFQRRTGPVRRPAPAAERASGAEESVPVPMVNRHRRRGREVVAREAQRRAA